MATTSTATPVTFDLAQEQQKLERRRRLLESMQGQLSTEAGGRMVGDRYVTAQPIGQVANLLSAFLAQKKLKQVDEDSSALSARYNSELSNGLSQYFSLKDGSPGVPMGPPTEGGEMGLVDERKPDPRKALLMALTSQLPPLQRMGEADLALQSKQGAEETFGQPQTVLGPDGKPQLQLFGNRGTQRPVSGVQPYEKPMTVGDRVVSGFAPDKLLADYSTKGGEQVTINGDLYQRMSDGMLRKLDSAPKISVTNNTTVTNKGETKFLEQLGGDRAKEFMEAEKAALQGFQTRNVVSQMKQLEKQGVFSGPTANFATALAGFAEVIGVPVDKAKLANSQAFQQQFAQQIGAYLANSSVGRTLTDKDRELLEKTMPTLLLSPQGRAQVYSMLEGSANTAITRHQNLQKRLQQAYPEAGGMLGISPVQDGGGPGIPPPVTIPQPGASTGSGQAIPLDQYLKQKQGSR